jgi:transketolase
MLHSGFEQPRLTDAQITALDALRVQCAGDIVKMTTLAQSGHPGGSLSSLHFLLVLYAGIRRPGVRDPDRDRVVVSHGHISPGTYSVLAACDYFPRERMLMDFRRAGTPFSGHVETCVPGVEWNTGNLGQGLSAGVGMALAARLRGSDLRVAVCMGDGEQQKGQIAEARRFAVKFGLANLFGVIDLNGLQIGGKTSDIMPQNIAGAWEAEGWNVLDVPDGHDWQQLYAALRAAYRHETARPERPTVVIAHTVMGKGVSFMENKHQFHGAAASWEQAAQALAEIGAENDLERLKAKRAALPLKHEGREAPPAPEVAIDPGQPRTLGVDVKTDCRSAYGDALADLAAVNNAAGAPPKVVGFTCDLMESVKMNVLKKAQPAAFFEAGIQEHHTAAMCGAMSREGLRVFFSTFGVFGCAETYNQQRLSDINEARLKVVLTHCGLDVGEDGPTHQNIDYLALFGSLFHFDVFAPADPNQCDRIIRCIAARETDSFVPMGRSKLPVIADETGKRPFFDEAYAFTPGKADRLRSGSEVALMAFGPTSWRAVKVHELLKAKGIGVEVWNMGSLKPLDREAVLRAAETGMIVTYEDHNVNTGLGLLVANVLAEERVQCRLLKLGVTFYGSSGLADQLYAEQGLSPELVAARVEAFLAEASTPESAAGGRAVPTWLR